MAFLPYEFEFTGASSDVEETLKRVKKVGFAILRGHVRGEALAADDREHGRSFADPASANLTKGKHPDYHGTHSVFSSPFDIARYFKDDVCRVIGDDMKPGGLRGNHRDH